MKQIVIDDVTEQSPLKDKDYSDKQKKRAHKGNKIILYSCYACKILDIF